MNRFAIAVPVTVALLAAACSDQSVTEPMRAPTPSMAATPIPGSYVILGAGNALPADLAARVAAAGGSLGASLPRIGVAVATSADPAFASKVRGNGVQDVVPDMMVQWTDPNEQSASLDDLLGGASIGDDETFAHVQWAPEAISAPAAWDAGARGAGVRVAILDGGIHSTHADLDGNLDVAHSASMVPGQAFNADVGTFWHGTHVAGIVAAEDNQLGTIGIAPSATLVGVKVLHNGSGAFSWIINGIYYASTSIADGGAGADIINMSLGAGFQKREQGAASLIVALTRAVNYAHGNGVTVIAALGNSGYDLDQTADLVFVPAQLPHVIRVSATGPLGYAQGATDYDRPASYTNFGASAVTFAAPGGDFALPGTANCSVPRVPSGTVAAPCWVFDMVISTSRGSGASTTSYSWAAGTSMASPAAAGVAALIIEHFGRIGPDQVESKMLSGSDDLGKPGNDPYYGGGRVNAWKSIQ